MLRKGKTMNKCAGDDKEPFLFQKQNQHQKQMVRVSVTTAEQKRFCCVITTLLSLFHSLLVFLFHPHKEAQQSLVTVGVWGWCTLPQLQEGYSIRSSMVPSLSRLLTLSTPTINLQISIPNMYLNKKRESASESQGMPLMAIGVVVFSKEKNIFVVSRAFKTSANKRAELAIC